MNRPTSNRQGRAKAFSQAVFTACALGLATQANAGATFKIDDTKWLSIGAGLRTSFTAREKAYVGRSGDTWSNDFNLDNIRLYLNAQVFKYLKLEFNTDCQTCNNGGEVRVLDAIAKVEYDPMINLWMGRMLVPAERREMNGPFYSPIYDQFGSGTPYEPSDFNTVIQNHGDSAGSYGRDDGATIWGAAFDGGRLQYAFGFFRGLRGGANQNDNVLYAQRVAYNFLEIEKNPGYYTSGTYYGKGGDILTIAGYNQYQDDGAGTQVDPGTFRGTGGDILFEKVLPNNNGVITFNGEYKNYGISGYSMVSRKLTNNGFAMFEGNAFDTSLMYLFPQKVWIGQFQPYLRYVGIMPTSSSDRNNYETGVNYVIDGHNARISLIYQYSDIFTKGLNYTDTASGPHVSSIKLGFQLQI